MTGAILTLRIHAEHDVIVARRRGRQIAGLLGFDPQNQARIATAVSEIARNAFDYACGGKVEYLIDGKPRAQQLLVRVSDQGPGIVELSAILAGRYRSRTGLGIGITGTRNLMDRMEIDTRIGEGTTVLFGKGLDPRSPPVGPKELARIADELVRQRPDDPISEMYEQNQALLRTMEELRLREEESARLAREAQEATRARDTMLAIVSHDLRNPLNAVLLSASFLLDVGIERAGLELLEKQLGVIKRSTQMANRLIEDLLDVARIEAGRLSIEPDAQDARVLVSEAYEALRLSAEEKSIQLEHQVPDEIPPTRVDRDRVIQVLCNLGANAIKFTPRGGRVILRAEPAEGEVRFSVSDTGSGVPAEQLEHIFDRYWQANRADRRGVGLGLAIVKGIVEAHGGKVWVESEVGVGTTCYFTVSTAD
jgi:signal transduction histidine kinase